MRYIAYYRVSTKKQGHSGLGLEAQQEVVRRYLREGEELIGEYTEIESGRKNKRTELQDAIREAKQKRARLLIAKLDRLSRNASFVMMLRDAEVDFVACDIPDANTLTVGIMASFAQHEAEQISKRTRAALAQLKLRGVKLGKPENFTEEVRKKGNMVRAVLAQQNLANRQAKELIRLYRQNNMTYQEICDKLNENGFRTRTGKLFWPISVQRLLKNVN